MDLKKEIFKLFTARLVRQKTYVMIETNGNHLAFKPPL